jgi:ATP-dependent Clp protease protease subunit
MSEYGHGQPTAEQLSAAPSFGHDAERVLKLRAAFADGFLNDEKAAALRLWLVALDTMSDESIMLHLSTNDAGLRAAFTVVDTMESMRSPVHVQVTGRLGGSALSILASAQRRSMTRHATLRLVEPQEQFDGTAAELAMKESEHRWLVDMLYIGLAKVTCRHVDEIRDDAKRGRLFTPTQAYAYGFVEKVYGLEAEKLDPEAQ